MVHSFKVRQVNLSSCLTPLRSEIQQIRYRCGGAVPRVEGGGEPAQGGASSESERRLDAEGRREAGTATRPGERRVPLETEPADRPRAAHAPDVRLRGHRRSPAQARDQGDTVHAR